MADERKPKGELTELRDRASMLEARLAEEEKHDHDDIAKAKWQTLREFVTGPNLKWIAGMAIVLALVLASMLSGVGFTVSEGGIVFGAGGNPPAGSLDVVETDAPPAPEEAPARPAPEVIVREVVRVVEVPVAAPPPPPPPAPPPVAPPPVEPTDVDEPLPTPMPMPMPMPVDPDSAAAPTGEE